MAEPRKSFDSPEVPMQDEIADTVGQVIQEQAVLNMEPRRVVTHDLAQSSSTALSEDAAPSSSRAHNAPNAPGSSLIPGPGAPLQFLSMEARSRSFSRMCDRFLREVNRPYPPASDRTVHGVVLDLGDVYAIRWIYEEFVRKSDLLLGEDGWAVAAFSLIPGAPLHGNYLGLPKTSPDIANKVKVIHQELVQPVCKYSNDLALKELMERKASAQATRSTNSWPIGSEATCTLPTSSENSGNALGLCLASPAAALPQTASALEVQLAPPATTLRPPIGLLDFMTQVVNQLYNTYLVACKKSMPPEAERTVGGKVIDIARLMAVTIGWYQQTRRMPSLAEWGGIAVAQFGFPIHANILSIADPRDFFTFTTSDPEFARGLQSLFVRHLGDFCLWLEMHPTAWQTAWGHALQRLDCAPFSGEDIARFKFVHAHDLLDVLHANMLARAVPPSHPDGWSTFPFSPGFSPLADIRERVRERVRTDSHYLLPPEPVRTLHVLSDEAQEWLRQWREFAGHRTHVLLRLDHIHETLQEDSEIERIFIMLSAYDSMYASDSSFIPAPRRLPSVAEQLGFPPRHLVNVETLKDWNSEYTRIWVDVHRRAKPGAVPQTAGAEALVPPRPALPAGMHASIRPLGPNAQ